MSRRIDRYCVEVGRRTRVPISDTLAFVEDPDFLTEFRDCGLDDDDLDKLQFVITLYPTSGDVVPVSQNVRDVIFAVDEKKPVIVRYVYLPAPASTVLLLTAYAGSESFRMTVDEANEAEEYIARQRDYFSTRYTH